MLSLMHAVAFASQLVKKFLEFNYRCIVGFKLYVKSPTVRHFVQKTGSYGDQLRFFIIFLVKDPRFSQVMNNGLKQRK